MSPYVNLVLTLIFQRLSPPPRLLFQHGPFSTGSSGLYLPAGLPPRSFVYPVARSPCPNLGLLFFLNLTAIPRALMCATSRLPATFFPSAMSLFGVFLTVDHEGLFHCVLIFLFVFVSSLCCFLVLGRTSNSDPFLQLAFFLGDNRCVSSGPFHLTFFQLSLEFLKTPVPPYFSPFRHLFFPILDS